MVHHTFLLYIRLKFHFIEQMYDCQGRICRLVISPRFYIHAFPGSLWTPTIGRKEKSGRAFAQPDARFSLLWCVWIVGIEVSCNHVATDFCSVCGDTDADGIRVSIIAIFWGAW